MTVRQVAVDTEPIPAGVAEQDGSVVGVLVDGSGAWDEGAALAAVVAPRLLESLPSDTRPLLAGVRAALIGIAEQLGPTLASCDPWDGASFGVLAVRIRGAEAEVASVGAMQAVRVGPAGSIAASQRQTLAELALREGKWTSAEAAASPMAHIQLSGVRVEVDGAAVLSEPWSTTWTLDSGDAVVLGSGRLADRWWSAADADWLRLVATAVAPEAVADLPYDAEADPYRWSERRYSAIVLRA